MTDTQPKQGLSSFGLMVMNVTGWTSIGERVGEAIAKIVAWEMAVKCQCARPPDIISGVHDVIVLFSVGLAFFIHSRFMKNL